MAKCKSCLHLDVCNGLYFNLDQVVERDCRYYKKRSDYVKTEEVQKWIPASEPPKTRGIYQVFGYDKDWERTKVWYGQFGGCDWSMYDIYGDGMRFDVTHWMPLPEPPKGD